MRFLTRLFDFSSTWFIWAALAVAKQLSGPNSLHRIHVIVHIDRYVSLENMGQHADLLGYCEQCQLNTEQLCAFWHFDQSIKLIIPMQLKDQFCSETELSVCMGDSNRLNMCRKWRWITMAPIALFRGFCSTHRQHIRGEWVETVRERFANLFTAASIL